jgi:hypothetical protein
VIGEPASLRPSQPAGGIAEPGKGRSGSVGQAASAAARFTIDATAVCVHTSFPCFVRMPAAVN